METKPKMYTVISLNKNGTSMKFVQMTLCQFGKYFSKDVINVLSQRRNPVLPINGKVGKISIVKMTIDSTECLVVNLFSSSFTNRFGGGNFKVYTKCIESLVETTDDVTETEKTTELVVDEQPILKILKTKPSSEW